MTEEQNTNLQHMLNNPLEVICKDTKLYFTEYYKHAFRYASECGRYTACYFGDIYRYEVFKDSFVTVGHVLEENSDDYEDSWSLEKDGEELHLCKNEEK